MSITTGTFPGVRIVDMPDLGAVSDTTSLVAEKAGSGRVTAGAMAAYAAAYTWKWSVRTWGAKGDGTTDDTAAIQAAATAAAPNGTIFFPAGTYRITAPVNVPPHVSLFGFGPSSIIAPATAGQTAFVFTNSGARTDFDATVADIQIYPTVDNCTGISATHANFLTIKNVMFTACAARSIYLDKCSWYTIGHCFVRSSMSFVGGGIHCTDTASTGGSAGTGNGSISHVHFGPMYNSPLGCGDPCIRLQSQPTTHVDHCVLAWGAYGGGPISFIILENQCQGNIISNNVCLGVYVGIWLLPGGMTSPVMPTYITITNNAIDSIGNIGILISGTTALPTRGNIITGNFTTQPQSTCTAATVAAGGSGYAVGDVLWGPVPPAGEEGQFVVLKVTSIGGGGSVAGVSIYNKGLTQTPPANPVSFLYGSGTGATFNLTYSLPSAGIWLTHTYFSTISGNFSETYAGHKVGYGIVLDTVGDCTITGNIMTGLKEAIFGFTDTNYDLLFSHNNLSGNDFADFGGTPPAFSLIQDNIGVPWVTTTPAMPASGVTVQNTAPYPQQVFIFGGTVTAINYLGTPLTTNTTGQPVILTLQRQHTISITYSVAPTWAWVPMA